MQRDLGAQDVAERAVGVRQRAEQIGVLVVGARRDDRPPGSSTSASMQPVVHEAVAEAGRLDADADRRAADRDVLELRRDERHEAVRQGMVDDGLVGREPFDLDRAGRGVERRARG